MDQPQAVTAPAPASRVTLAAAIILLAGLVVFGWAAPATFDVYKMLHVLASVVWVGGGAALVILALLTERENDPRTLVALAHRSTSSRRGSSSPRR